MLLACGSTEATWTARGPDGARKATFVVTFAETETSRRLGLSNQPPLAKHEGLLLRFPVPGRVCIHNREVGFPLDLVFVETGGLVTAVERAVPAYDPTRRCQPAVLEVLEVRAGSAQSVAVGDRRHLN